jgi:hypothetical protein
MARAVTTTTAGRRGALAIVDVKIEQSGRCVRKGREEGAWAKMLVLDHT